MGGPEDDLQTLPPLGRGAPLSRLRGDVRTEARSRGPGGPRVPMTAKRKRTSPNGGVRRPPGPLTAVQSIGKVADVRPEREPFYRSNLASFPACRAYWPGPFPTRTRLRHRTACAIPCV